MLPHWLKEEVDAALVHENVAAEHSSHTALVHEAATEDDVKDSLPFGDLLMDGLQHMLPHWWEEEVDAALVHDNAAPALHQHAALAHDATAEDD
eukprot:scaffold13739_cov97-Skeletonema_menzelii.AAC.1